MFTDLVNSGLMFLVSVEHDGYLCIIESAAVGVLSITQEWMDELQLDVNI